MDQKDKDSLMRGKSRTIRDKSIHREGKNFIISSCLQPFVFLMVSVPFTLNFISMTYSDKNKTPTFDFWCVLA